MPTDYANGFNCWRQIANTQVKRLLETVPLRLNRRAFGKGQIWVILGTRRHKMSQKLSKQTVAQSCSEPVPGSALFRIWPYRLRVRESFRKKQTIESFLGIVAFTDSNRTTIGPRRFDFHFPLPEFLSNLLVHRADFTKDRGVNFVDLDNLVVVSFSDASA